MEALVIVSNPNVFKDGCACQCMGCKLAGHTFSFSRAEETFSDCVVVTVANPAHAHLDVGACQTARVGSIGTLAVLIRMIIYQRPMNDQYESYIDKIGR